MHILELKDNKGLIIADIKLGIYLFWKSLRIQRMFETNSNSRKV